MAKAPKKRNKKMNNISIMQREINTIVNLAYQGVAFLGDCYHKPRAMNIQKLWTHLRGVKHEPAMKTFLGHLERPMDWSLGLVCFFKNKENEFELINVISRFKEDFTLKEVSENLSKVIIEGINNALNVDEKFNNENFVYYAYVLIPEYHPETMEKRVDGLGHLMINLGEIECFEAFGDDLPGIPSTETTLLEAIENNGIFPKIKSEDYFPVNIVEYLYEENTDDAAKLQAILSQ